ncbi:hypothetical protein JW848_05570, partial [Candidatus Bipolaricaulota bacterium]|nr:hypothetical protein [Candidatus Bipolaricaulota bacterium]
MVRKSGTNALAVPCAITAESGFPPQAFITHEKKKHWPINPMANATSGMYVCDVPGTRKSGRCHAVHTKPRTM